MTNQVSNNNNTSVRILEGYRIDAGSPFAASNPLRSLSSPLSSEMITESCISCIGLQPLIVLITFTLIESLTFLSPPEGGAENTAPPISSQIALLQFQNYLNCLWSFRIRSLLRSSFHQ